ncbi:hypothetical protein DGM98_14150 [Xanthomonas citri]|uniref:Uncharacterized protein n=5 Tax=Xanthomonas TaxID=338 RepID=A0A7Z7NG88_XANCH|nr:hypothetical protein DGM98_14150 [Xanthomonas citri]SON96819.1 hypothetical protein XFF6990_390130 [Xanthomonas citri pv. fuscans]SOO23473.1 hypothetical protein XFF6991_280132 [Xanthomonas phaseoli pv. phaseoli]
MLCPMAVAWGDVATWVSGVAAAGAVVVALWTSRGAKRIALESREAADRAAAEERARLKVARDDQAACLAIVFHHELFLLHGQLKFYAATLRSNSHSAERRELMQSLAGWKPQGELTMLTRLADSLEVFERDARAALLTALSGWMTLQLAPSAESLQDVPLALLQQNVIATANIVANVARACARAAMAIHPLVLQTYPEAPQLVE